MEWRGTHALSLTYKLHNLKNKKKRKTVMLFLHQMKMFLPLIIKAHYCIDIVTRRLFSTYKSVLVLPRYCCIAIVVTCTGFFIYIYIFAPLHLCLTNLKGLPLSCSVSNRLKTQGINSYRFLFQSVQFFSCQRKERKTPGDPLQNTTQWSGLLAAAQPI